MITSRVVVPLQKLDDVPPMRDHGRHQLRFEGTVEAYAASTEQVPGHKNIGSPNGYVHSQNPVDAPAWRIRSEEIQQLVAKFIRQRFIAVRHVGQCQMWQVMHPG